MCRIPPRRATGLPFANRPRWGIVPGMFLRTILALLLATFAGSLWAEDAPRTILFFGDSLTAGYGLADPATEAYPAVIQDKIKAAGYHYAVLNGGLSGDTTAGGLHRIDWLLRRPHPPPMAAPAAGGGRPQAREPSRRRPARSSSAPSPPPKVTYQR